MAEVKPGTTSRRGMWRPRLAVIVVVLVASLGDGGYVFPTANLTLRTSARVSGPFATEAEGSIGELPTAPLQSGGATSVQIAESGLVWNDIGCVSDLDAETLDSAFRNPFGPLIGWDNPHVYSLGADRWLWMVHDSYFDYTGDFADLHHDGPQIQNLAFLQVGTCFRLLYRGSPNNRSNFEPGDLDEPRFLWPLGGERHGDTLWVFWSEMADANPPPDPADGISRNPVRIWLAEYDPDTLEQRSFKPAPNDGVFPSYGFAVASDDTHTYLFGNSNLLNYESEGGYLGGPHSATRMYIARVPLGRLNEDPLYWSGDGWTPDPKAAAVISDRFFAENTMQPRYIGGRWLAVTKQDGFSGTSVVLDAADDPWGPWHTVDQTEYITREATVAKNSYQPIILPWSSPDQGIQFAISENAVSWPDAVANPNLYRPSVHSFDWPAD